MEVELGDTTYLNFTTQNNETLAAADAASTPTVAIYEDDGSAMGYTPTAAKHSTGHYYVGIAHTAANGFEEDKWYNVRASGTVASVAGKGLIGRFRVREFAWQEAQLGDTIHMHFETHHPNTGASADAAADTAAVDVFEDDGHIAAFDPTVTKKATGEYHVAIAATSGNGFEADKSYNVLASATVNSIAAKGIIGTFKLRPAASSTDIEQALYSRLKNDAGVFGEVGLRIYPQVIPDDASMPAVAYSRVGGEHIRSLTGSSMAANPRYELICWADTLTGAKAVAEQVRDCLDGYSGTIDSVTIHACVLENDSDLLQQQAGADAQRHYGIEMTFNIWHSESDPEL